GLYRGFVPNVIGICVYRGLYFGGYDSIRDTVLVGPLQGNFLASFAVGWGCTTGAALAAYPLDTIRRRMMMTSGGAVRYKSFIDAGTQIIAKEGARALFGQRATDHPYSQLAPPPNVFRGVASAGVLALYDQFQEIAWG
ncbi:mitochondrial carrier domain-containing protein, partial [Amylocystis lapponica]